MRTKAPRLFATLALQLPGSWKGMAWSAGPLRSWQAPLSGPQFLHLSNLRTEFTADLQGPLQLCHGRGEIRGRWAPSAGGTSQEGSPGEKLSPRKRGRSDWAVLPTRGKERAVIPGSRGKCRKDEREISSSSWGGPAG